MEGLVFTISLLSILVAVGGLFAWMVRMASYPDIGEQAKTSADLSR